MWIITGNILLKVSYIFTSSSAHSTTDPQDRLQPQPSRDLSWSIKILANYVALLKTHKFYQMTELGRLSQTTNLYFPFSKSPGNRQSSHNMLGWSQAHSHSCVKIINYFVDLMAVKYWQNLRCRVVRHE